MLTELTKVCEPIHVASDLARSFITAVRERDVPILTAWTESAYHATASKEMNGFAQDLVRNWPEVKAAVQLPGSNGRTEGHVNRLKLIERLDCGRDHDHLLKVLMNLG